MHAKVNFSNGDYAIVPIVNDRAFEYSTSLFQPLVGRTKIRKNKLIEKRHQDRVKDRLSSVGYVQNHVAVAVTRLQGSTAVPMTSASTPGEDSTPVKSVPAPLNLLALSNTTSTRHVL